MTEHDEHSTPTPPPPAAPSTSTQETAAPEGDTRDWAKDDQETAERMREALGVRDTVESPEGAQEAAEGRERPRKVVEIDLGWGVSEDGEPSVVLNKELPAQGYALDDMERFRDELSNAIATAQRMAALWEWLADNGIEVELRRKLVMDAFNRCSAEAAKESLLSLAFGSMLPRGW